MKPIAFQELWEVLGPFSLDLMASSESTQRVPGRYNILPFFSQYDCEGSSGTDEFAHDVSRLPGMDEQMFVYCFPPPVMVSVIVQHSAEWQSHAVIVVPDTRESWFPVAQQASIRSIVEAPTTARGLFQWPSHREGLKDWR